MKTRDVLFAVLFLSLVSAALAAGARADAAPPSWSPPGSTVSASPSEEIFPPQTIAVRFSHQLHAKKLGLPCGACHDGAYTSQRSSDLLLPQPTKTCDLCHGTDHADVTQVVAGKTRDGRCGSCHEGAAAGEGGRVAATVMPSPHLVFPHGKHFARNIGCGQCHGQVAEVDRVTRDHLPRMAGCLACHAMSGAARGDAKSTCTTCHLIQPNGRLQTTFSTGRLTPPRWLRGAAHDADWGERHKKVAGGDSGFCGSCHTDKECVACHDGEVRPRRVHPNDWLSMHPQAARQDNPRCSSCHHDQTFCGDCHRRTGVARDAPSGNRAAGRRFHPSPEQWTTAPRGPQHHAWEAMRNLNVCVSCHSERDCVTCHATRGLGGGVNPHPVGFREKCGLALRRNARPCLVCHASSDRLLGACR